MPVGTEVILDPGDFAFDGDSAIPPEKSTPTPTQFLAHVYCGQTAADGWIKMTLGTQVKLGPGDVVLDEVAAPPKRGTAPRFSVHVYYGKRMDEDTTWYGSRPRPRPHCIRRGPSSPLKRHSTPTPSLFGPSPLWPRSPMHVS